MSDRDRELRGVLSDIVGRPLRTHELVAALGLSRSAYYLQRDEGRLVSADNLLRLADEFGINPVDLLLRYRFITTGDVQACDPALGARTRAAQRSRRWRTLAPRADAPPI
jgi:DNA-binding Xre family transcriptional regulator